MGARTPRDGDEMMDRDGMADSWEAQYGFDTNNTADATLDFDGDGMSNRDEYTTATNPTDANELLKLSILHSQSVTLQFMAQPNVDYFIEYRTNLSIAPWHMLNKVAATNQSRAIEIIDAVDSPSGNKFYRVRTPTGP